MSTWACLQSETFLNIFTRYIFLGINSTFSESTHYPLTQGTWKKEVGSLLECTFKPQHLPLPYNASSLFLMLSLVPLCSSFSREPSSSLWLSWVALLKNHTWHLFRGNEYLLGFSNKREFPYAEKGLCIKNTFSQALYYRNWEVECDCTSEWEWDFGIFKASKSIDSPYVLWRMRTSLPVEL